MVEALLSGFGGGLVVSKLLDTVLPFGMTAQGKLFKRQAALQRELEKTEKIFRNGWKNGACVSRPILKRSVPNCKNT